MIIFIPSVDEFNNSVVLRHMEDMIVSQFIPFSVKLIENVIDMSAISSQYIAVNLYLSKEKQTNHSMMAV